jgi:iron complex outermembrane receptor protein
MNKTINYNIAAHYTHGEGYYEQEKLGEELTNYNLENIILNNDTITSSDLIRRKWLNNDFGGLTLSLTNKIGSLDLILGGATNRYSGQHYGNIIWAKYASNADFNHQYYWNKAEKWDHNFYAKANYKYNNATNLYADLQIRKIDYTFVGYDEDGSSAKQKVSLASFNPKFGVYHDLNKNQFMYVSFAVANKEPNRNDYVESTPNSRPENETLYDTEVGYKQNGNKLSLGINIYQMNYKNQLVITGQINDVGAYTRTNIDKSFRRGIELDGILSLGNKIKWSGNITLSQNKITNYTAYIDNWDNGEQIKVEYKNTDLAFSPSIIWASQFSLKLNDKIHIDFISKYVGEQFIDNTSSEDRMLDYYLVNNLRIFYKWNSNIFKTTTLILQVNNLLNNKYVSNAWVYRFISDNWDPRDSDPYVNIDSKKGYNQAAYFPEATRNYLLGFTLEF